MGLGVDVAVGAPVGDWDATGVVAVGEGVAFGASSG
jgi:hypothetical protein